jgi:hypothetical protein
MHSLIALHLMEVDVDTDVTGQEAEVGVMKKKDLRVGDVTEVAVLDYGVLPQRRIRERGLLV